jgi:hypothetical protein
MRKKLPDELWYMSFRTHKLLDKRLEELYDVPKHLSRKLEKPWEEQQITPEKIHLTEEERLQDGKSWNYVAISCKYFELYGTHLNRAEVQYVIKNKLTESPKEPKFLTNLEQIKEAIKQLDTAEDKVQFYHDHIKSLI